MKALVVGCGSIGRRHLQNLLRTGSGPLAACDPDPDARTEVSRLATFPVFAEVPEALDWGPDAVLICTPTHLHAPVALRALEAGAHLFIEKPIALDPVDADEIAQRAAAAGRTVLVGCNMRFHPALRAIKELLDAGDLGRPWLITAHFSHYLPNWRPGRDYRASYSARAAEGGGIVLEAVHEIDYVSWLGDGITAVGCVGGRASDLDIDAEDVAVLYCRLGNGAAGVIRLDYLRLEKSRGCEVSGSRGLIQWLSEGKQPERMRVRVRRAGGDVWETILGVEAYDPNEEYVAELQHFIRCVRGEERPAVDAAAAARVLRVALEARRQIADGSPVSPAPPR